MSEVKTCKSTGDYVNDAIDMVYETEVEPLKSSIAELEQIKTQAVALLERALRDLHVNPGDFESDETEMMIQAFLARYHAGEKEIRK